MNDVKALEVAMEYNSIVTDSERWADFSKRCKKGSEYYRGLQTYTTEIRERLEREGRPCLTFNEILPVINYLTSLERDNRKDTKAIERRGGYEWVAKLITELIKHIMDMCDGDYIKSDVFLNGVRSGAGWFGIEIDYDRDPVTGQIIVRSRPPLAVRPDPGCLSNDLNDSRNGASFVIDSDWQHKDKLKAKYPKEAPNIDVAIEGYIADGKIGVIDRIVDAMFGNNESDTDNDEIIFDRDSMNKWRARVHTTWIKEHVTRTMVCNKENWSIAWFDPKKKKDQERLDKLREIASKKSRLFEIKEKQPMALLHKVVRVGNLLLEHVEDPFNGVCLFPLVPFTPFGDTQYDMGVIDNLIGPQDELNKRMTNAVQIINSVANSGWRVGKSDDVDAIRLLRDFGSSPNMVLDVSKYGGLLEKIQPNSPPIAHLDMVSRDKNFIEEIGGVTGASRGLDPNRQESGKLYRAKVQQSMATNQIIFDRYDYSCKILGYTTMEIVRATKTYTDEEISFLIDDNDLVGGELLDDARRQVMQTQPPPVNPIKLPAFATLPEDQIQAIAQQYEQMLAQYTQKADQLAVQIAKQELLKQFKAHRTGKYGVIVTRSPNAPTTQMSNFYELSDLRELVPPQILAPYLIRATGLPKDQKDEMIDQLEKITQQVMPT